MKLVVQHVTKSCAGQPAITDVSLVCGAGTCALLGPNGSGKSTLLRVLATLTPPDTGTIHVNQQPYTGDLRAIRRTLGYLPQHLDLPHHMTPHSLLRYVARLKGVSARRQVPEILATLGLTSLARRRIGALSGGQIRLLGIAQALLGDPHLALLDEPFAGLDVDERIRVGQLLQQRQHQMITLLSTHLPDEVAASVEQVVVLKQGRVIATGSPAALRTRAAGSVHELRIEANDVAWYTAHCRVSRITPDENGVRLRVVGALPPQCSGTPVDASLEDAYLLLQHEQAVDCP